MAKLATVSKVRIAGVFAVVTGFVLNERILAFFLFPGGQIETEEFVWVIRELQFFCVFVGAFALLSPGRIRTVSTMDYETLCHPSPRYSASRKAMLLVIGCGVAATCVVLVAISRYGPAITPDSVNYIAAARHVLAGEGFLRYDGELYLRWAPLTASVLAFLGLTGISLVWLGGIMNACTLGLIVGVSGIWLLKSLRSSVLAIIGTLCIAVFGPLLHVSMYVWSEPLFILFVILSLWQTERFLASRKIKFLILGAVLAALACLTRYIGITLVVTGLILLFFTLDASFRKRIRACIIFGSISTFPMILWLIRNQLAAGCLTGWRSASTTSFLENVSLSGEVLSHMVLPVRVVALGGGAWWFAGVVILSLGMVAIVGYRRYQRRQIWKCSATMCVIIFCGVYTGIVLLSATLVAFDDLNWRLLSPVCVPWVLMVFFSLDELFFGRPPSLRCHSLGKSMSKRAFIALILAIFFWVTFSSARNFVRVKFSILYGAGGYNSKTWHESETVAYIRAHHIRDPVFSNAPDAIYFFTGRPAHNSPHRFEASKAKAKNNELKEFESRVDANRGATLVWFEEAEWRTYLYSLEELQEILRVECFATLPDGSVCWIDAYPSFGRDR